MSKQVISWKEALASQSQAATAAAVADVTVIGTKGGNLVLGDQQLPNNTVQCLISAFTFERAYYEGAYDADNIISPTCFATGLEKNMLIPHENVEEPVNAECRGCPMAEFGTAQQGKGPACKTRVKFALIPVSDNPTGEEIMAAKMVTTKCPPTSVKNWEKYLGGIGAKGLAPWCTVTELFTKPSKFMFSMFFDMNGKLMGDELMEAAFARAHEGEAMLEQGVWTYEEEAEPAAEASTAKFSKKGAK